jgi:hypothetical protein
MTKKLQVAAASASPVTTWNSAAWAIALSLAAGATAAEQLEVIDLGHLGEGTSFQTWAIGIAQNGEAVAGGTRAYSQSGTTERAFHWTPSGGMREVVLPGFPAASSYILPQRLSADGSTVAGLVSVASSNAIYRLFAWHTDGSVKYRGNLGSVNVYGISADGSLIVGSSTSGPAGEQAFAWYPATDTLIFIDGGNSGTVRRAMAVSPNGQAWIGDLQVPSGYSVPCVGDFLTGAIAPLYQSSSGPIYEGGLRAISDTGYICGYGAMGSGSWMQRGFRRAPDGDIEFIQPVPGSATTEAYSLSTDGTRIGGVGINPWSYPYSRSLIWSSDWGSIALDSCLQALGTPGVAGWTMIGVAYLSADGNYAACTGDRFGQTRACLVRGINSLGPCKCIQNPNSPDCCPEDLYRDQVVNGADLGILLSTWNQWGSVSDLTRDGVVDGADLGVLLNAWGPCRN